MTSCPSAARVSAVAPQENRVCPPPWASTIGDREPSQWSAASFSDGATGIETTGTSGSLPSMPSGRKTSRRLPQ